MASHRISVTVGNDSIQVSPDSLFMTTADDVAWAGTTSNPFTITFEGEGPFGMRHLTHANATGTNRARAKGRFKYTVTSTEKPGVQLDPDIIVGDPPTQKP